MTPVPTCDPALSVTFDAANAGTVLVAPTATAGTYTCSVNFLLSGQAISLVEHVSVDVPGLSINDVSMLEGSFPVGPIEEEGPGTTPATFTVTMSEPSTATVTVPVATANISAFAPADYLAVDTTVTFPPGETTEAVTVPVVGDTTRELDETFSVNLSAASGAAITDGQGVGTIQNDDSTLIHVGAEPGPVSPDRTP